LKQEIQQIGNNEGIKIYYRHKLPPNPKAVVVICHGYAEHSYFYLPLMERLAAEGYGAYALDHRGHGYSEAERGHLDRFETFLEDLDFFVDYVQGLHPTLPFFMFGHSMGGLITFNYGILHPEKLKGQIFSGAALDRPVGTEKIPAFIFWLGSVLFKKYKIRPNLRGKTTRNKQVRKVSDGDPLVLRYGTMGFFYEFACRGVSFAQKKAECYNLPCLFLHGIADGIVACQSSEKTFPRISSQDKTLKLYEGLYHELIHEPEGEEVLADILSWLKERVR